jgi:hypothetical protein
MPLVTNVNQRNQSAYGSFQPRADLARFGVVYAAIGDGGDGRFPHLDQVMTEGLPAGNSGQSLTYEEYRDTKGNTHDVTLGNGMKVREMIAPIADIHAKNDIERRESQELVDQYTIKAGIHDRPSADGRVHLSAQVTENRLGTAMIGHEELPTLSPVAKAMPKAKAVNGWTPERRAQASALAKARLQSKTPTTNTT